MRPPILTRLAVLVLLCAVAPAQAPDPTSIPAHQPLPQDIGVAALQQTLRRLHTTARLIHTTAHPDDEDGGMLTLESRGQGVTALLLTLNRGEGGQNKMGSNLFDELGLLRTLELLAADRYYAVEQRFTHVADFGYSKSAEETFQKWRGHDTALADMVRVIRTFRPDVLVSRFEGSKSDGHGHHEAAGILTREAFHAAADPNRFPEQIREGLQPWQPKKLYTDGFRASQEYTIKLDTGTIDTVLATSPAQLAFDGLRHQLSQGAGSWQFSSRPHFSYYRLAESVVPVPDPKAEKSFFDGIDTSLPGLANRIGAEQSKVPFLKPGLLGLAKKVDEATAAAAQNPSGAVKPLLEGLAATGKLLARVRDSGLSAAARADLLTSLDSKRDQFQAGANQALGLTIDLKLSQSEVVRGESFTASVVVSNHGTTAVTLRDVALDVPKGWKVEALSGEPAAVAPGAEVERRFRLTVAADAEYTRPYWRRGDPEADTVYTIDDPRYLTLPMPPEPVAAHADYVVDGLAGQIATSRNRHLAGAITVVPEVSLLAEPSRQVLPIGSGRAAEVHVQVRSYAPSGDKVQVRVGAPPGWKMAPESQPLKLQHRGQPYDAEFRAAPRQAGERHYAFQATAAANGRPYAEGFSIVTRNDLGAFPYYQPATQVVSAINLKLLPGLKIGYIMGAGDDIPQVLRELGFDVALLSADDLATGDLGRFATIICGIRAYDTRDDLKKYHQRLLDYVSAGGTLLVQYNTGTADFNSGKFTPYPGEIGRGRVSVEEAPVQILAPADPIFHFPNPITPADFDGWVQERGLYFMEKWDPHFEPLLSSHDPGEPPLEGGLLRAHYGKGVYLYTGYAFFRQLPFGVPGAVRLYVNLVSAGHEPH